MMRVANNLCARARRDVGLNEPNARGSEKFLYSLTGDASTDDEHPRWPSRGSQQLPELAVVPLGSNVQCRVGQQPSEATARVKCRPDDFVWLW